VLLYDQSGQRLPLYGESKSADYFELAHRGGQ